MSMNQDANALWWPVGSTAQDTTSLVTEKPIPLVRRIGLDSLYRRALDILYPAACIGCTVPLGEADGVCPACWRQLPLIEKPYCERLGTPLPADFGLPLLSAAAIKDAPVFGRARAVARYDDLARELVHRLKYGDRLELALPMGRWMARAGRDVLNDATLLIPIPLHRRRYWGRRFNQAGVLADAIGKQTGCAVAAHFLKRIKSTQSQVGLTRNERLKNLQGAFSVATKHRRHIAGARIVLVDDVMTTASTANAAARVLLRAGAASVDVLVFACVAKAG
jgi:ComF family protein